ncbi:nucleoside transporter-like protein family [Tothia fuscella]|uniref:Nucleoside transporter-like protein family n=1 Tax=Tothia fuscella TaxID=1048955 RepID=A0A9P4TT33_9PEZI|nr:nucleoside transporter-like protein family [Tothia fuscella]
MERFRRMTQRKSSYDRLDNDSGYSEPESRPLTLSEPEDDEEYQGGSYEGSIQEVEEFSWLVYSVFTLLGVAMLWSWNMFLAAGPYFQKRFKSNEWILINFQPAELTVSTVANLLAIVVLTNMQAKASYSKRIVTALLISVVAFTLLAISTTVFTGVSAAVYFAFLMVMVLSASSACGIMQNGIYAYVAGFGREEYTQGIMTGQAVAGVLPCVVQILSVISASEPDSDSGDFPEEKSTSAMAYFLTATAISLLTLAAFFYLANKHAHESHAYKHVEEDMTGSGVLAGSALIEPERKPVALRTLFRKTFWLAISVFLSFCITMFYPVLTQQILSLHPVETAPALLRPASFIPLAFFFWNLGDFFGRLLTAYPPIRLSHRPKLVFLLAIARVVFIPLYYLCNVGGKGAVVGSDVFYLGLELLFGITNGYIGSTCMMGVVEYVDVEEREAAGGFMGLMLVAGLTTGSLLSFMVA